MYFIASSLSEWSRIRRTGGGEIDSPAPNAALVKLCAALRRLRCRNGEPGSDYGALTRRALDPQPAVHRGGAVAQPEQPGAPVAARAANAVVADLERQHAPVDDGDDLRVARVGVLDS